MSILPVRHRTLANGLTAVAVQRPLAHTAVICADVRVGARYERPRDSGLSHFLEHMVFQGCEGFPTPEALNEAAECMGAALDASTGRDSTHFEHHVDPARTADSLALLSALLRDPAFASIESERAIVLEEALDEVDEDGRCIDADALSREDLWPDSPLGQTVIGRQSNLERFGVPDLRRHHERHYGARNLVVTVVGPEAPEAQLDGIEARFGTLRSGERLDPEPPGKLPGAPQLRYVKDGRSQADCRLVFRTPGGADPDAPAIQLLRATLDDGLASRLHRRLGAELGLAYDQWAAWERYWDTGAFELGAQVSPRKVPTFFEEAQRLLWGLVTDPPHGAELARIRFRARWALTSSLDYSDALAALYGGVRLYDPDPPDLAERLARLERVGPDDLARVARRILEPAGCVACVVGPLDRTARRAVSQTLKAFRGEPQA